MIPSKKEIKEIFKNVNSKSDVINAFIKIKEEYKEPGYVKFSKNIYNKLREK